jgi:hypothetical protein
MCLGAGAQSLGTVDASGHRATLTASDRGRRIGRADGSDRRRLYQSQSFIELLQVNTIRAETGKFDGG